MARSLLRTTLALVGVLALPGCAALTQVAGLTVSPQAAAVAVNAFDALEAAGTVYISLKTCGPAAPVPCKTVDAARKVVAAVQSGRIARNEVEALLAASAGGPIPVASYQTLQGAIVALQSASTVYGSLQ